MLSLGYVVSAFGAWMFLGEAVSPQRLVAIGVIIVGVVLLART
jgi:multidrug transporter EmrE-like cation transporter